MQDKPRLSCQSTPAASLSSTHLLQALLHSLKLIAQDARQQHNVSDGFVPDFRQQFPRAKQATYSTPWKWRAFETISVVEAATLVTNPFTAALSLFHQSGLDFPFPGTNPIFEYHSAHVVVLGAESSFAFLRALGATHVIDWSSPSIAATVQSILGSSVINVVEAYGSAHPTLAVSLLEVSVVSGTIIMLASSAAADTAALADKGTSLHNVYGSFEAHPILFRQWVAALPKWLSTGDMGVLPHRVVRGLNPQAVNVALDDIGKGGGVRYVVQVHVDDGDGDDGEEARDI
ncbi:hypothetical protein CGCSCA4_v010217 [Colletotrichum siamense]|uniref:Uncharacterized protein n=1 Tax=Colletotrichum siamense TaxID=690259 RepID=A0A9P5K2X3_COLSI|nr:hypothetical protein CGCSCA4_v010217 [Colletotrichum siamense]KAF4855414.1 hypothetical protein CGCSCA2_v009158 [Colletotrichum siamense]